MLNCYDFTMAIALKHLVDARRAMRSSRDGAIQGVQPLHAERSKLRTVADRHFL